MADAKVKIPGIGEVSKKTAVLGGVASAAVVAFAVYRFRKNQQTQAASQTAATSNTGQVTDPAGNVCSALAASGYCPGTAEDNAYQEQLAGGGGYGIGVGTPGGYDGSGYYGSPGQVLCADGSTPTGYDQYGNPECGSSTTTTSGTGNITTNSEWVQEVDTMFPNYTTAVAKVLGGVTVTTTEKNQFLEATGVFGQPPQGYPTPIKTSDTSGHPGQGSKVTVPKVVGLRGEVAKSNLEAAGFKVVQIPGATPKGKTTTVTSQAPAGGASVARGTTVETFVKVS